MLERIRSMRAFTWSAISLTSLFLLIEFFDELHYGIGSAVLPAMRFDLGLSYSQVGLLLGLPGVIGTFIEPALMLLGDTWLRKKLVVGGGLVIVLTLLLTGSAQTFPALLVAAGLSYPASGAFVSLSQATLMDIHPGRESQMMARWTVFGSFGNLVGPLMLAGGFALAVGWRWTFFGLAILAAGLTFAIYRRPFPARSTHHSGTSGEDRKPGMKQLFGFLWEGIHNRKLIHWVVLLELSDLMLDIYTGYALLYMTDIIGATLAQASLLFTLMMLSSLAGDLILIPLLEKVQGRQIVRFSALITAIIFTAALLSPNPVVKIVLLVAVCFSTLGWYQVLQGEAFASARGRSGTVSAINSLAGVVQGGLAWSVGYIAAAAGLQNAMWLLLVGPICLLLFIPRSQQIS